MQRGSLTIWISEAAIATWVPAGTGNRGGQQSYSDVAVETALTLRLVFHLPLRQAEGFLRSILQMMDLDLAAPDHTTLSRRSRHLSVELGPVGSRRRPCSTCRPPSVEEGTWVASASPSRECDVPLQVDPRASAACA